MPKPAFLAAVPWLGGCESFGPGDLPGSVAYRPKGIRGTALREGAWRVEIGTAVVTAVLITHFHPDHINGLREPDGTPAFPKATIHVPKPEWDWPTGQ